MTWINICDHHHQSINHGVKYKKPAGKTPGEETAVPLIATLIDFSIGTAHCHFEITGRQDVRHAVIFAACQNIIKLSISSSAIARRLEHL
jgi:hypothetical protein